MVANCPSSLLNVKHILSPNFSKILVVMVILSSFVPTDSGSACHQQISLIIVATCGLNTALREMKTGKNNDLEIIGSEIPSLDKFLVKHVSRLEREVQEAKK